MCERGQERVRLGAVLCYVYTFHWHFFKNRKKKQHAKHTNFLQLNIAILLFLLSCLPYRARSVHVPMPVYIRWYMAYKHTLVWFCVFFINFSPIFMVTHAMECWLSGCAQVAIFSLLSWFVFVSFYVLNIAFISFRCGFSDADAAAVVG